MIFTRILLITTFQELPTDITEPPTGSFVFTTVLPSSTITVGVSLFLTLFQQPSFVFRPLHQVVQKLMVLNGYLSTI